ncbi:hypothetical protein JL09_g2587 [Pichia kudriavzevii]|uniref:Ubiquitin-like domain-containing protein n=1 Tax=Pichia kudriavzevii TaxID=4909 RepID=A0A099P1Z7_PICKU|nr:hypothetical protein JL09_g2587 [Pichia kudriavzevii]
MLQRCILISLLETPESSLSESLSSVTSLSTPLNEDEFVDDERISLAGSPDGVYIDSDEYLTTDSESDMEAKNVFAGEHGADETQQQQQLQQQQQQQQQQQLQQQQQQLQQQQLQQQQQHEVVEDGMKFNKVPLGPHLQDGVSSLTMLMKHKVDSYHNVITKRDPGDTLVPLCIHFCQEKTDIKVSSRATVGEVTSYLVHRFHGDPKQYHYVVYMGDDGEIEDDLGALDKNRDIGGYGIDELFIVRGMVVTLGDGVLKLESVGDGRVRVFGLGSIIRVKVVEGPLLKIKVVRPGREGYKRYLLEADSALEAQSMVQEISERLLWRGMKISRRDLQRAEGFFLKAHVRHEASIYTVDQMKGLDLKVPEWMFQQLQQQQLQQQQQLHEVVEDGMKFNKVPLGPHLQDGVSSLTMLMKHKVDSYHNVITKRDPGDTLVPLCIHFCQEKTDIKVSSRATVGEVTSYLVHRFHGDPKQYHYVVYMGDDGEIEDDLGALDKNRDIGGYGDGVLKLESVGDGRVRVFGLGSIIRVKVVEGPLLKIKVVRPGREGYKRYLLEADSALEAQSIVQEISERVEQYK